MVVGSKTHQKSVVCVIQHPFSRNLENSFSRTPHLVSTRNKNFIALIFETQFPLPQKPQHPTPIFPAYLP